MTKTIIRPIRIDPDLDTAIRAMAQKHGYPTLSAFIRAAIRWYMREVERADPDRNPSVDCDK